LKIVHLTLKFGIPPLLLLLPGMNYLHTMVKALKQFLSRFADLDEKDIGLLYRLGECRSFDKKVGLINIGETDQHVNLVIKGLVRKYFLRGQEEVITELAMEGQLINSSVSFLSDVPSCYIVETIEPTILFSIRRDQIRELYSMNAKWERIGLSIMKDLYLQKEKQDHERNCYNTRERFLHFIENHAELLNRIPQKYLASYLHIQPETFSRLKHLLVTPYGKNQLSAVSSQQSHQNYNATFQ